MGDSVVPDPHFSRLAYRVLCVLVVHLPSPVHRVHRGAEGSL